MLKYSQQTLIYTRYFAKVMGRNPTVLIYTIGLPIFFLILNTAGHFFKPLTPIQYAANVAPFISWMIFSSALQAVSAVAILREQGYLKQYQSLVTSPSVILVAETLISFIQLGISITLVGGLSGLVFNLPFLPLLAELWLTLLLSFPAAVCFCLPLLAFSAREKTVDALVNLISIGVVFASFGLAAVMTPAIQNPLFNILSPLFLGSFIFRALVSQIGAYPLTYIISLIVLGIIGYFSYRHLKILPAEVV